LAQTEPKVRWVEAGKHRGKCIVEPLLQGYGTTLGNALRRVLLSQIKGAAVVAMRIQGVQHEFSTLRGMKENALEFMLNVKKLAFRTNGEGEWTASLYARGEGEVLGGDLKTPPDVEVVNPELHLAELTSEDAVLDVEFRVRTGKGYEPSEEHANLPKEIGLIPVDAIFSPVTAANAVVEPTRVGRDTNYDRLVLDITTDGSVTPQEALDAAARNLVQQLGIFLKDGQGLELPGAAEGQGELEGDDLLSKKVEELEFSRRTLNCLAREGIDTLADLVEKSAEDLIAMKNFGKKSLAEVQEKLAELGLALKGEDEPKQEIEPVDYIEE